jgi:putative protein-disulfide isomerase
MCSWCWGFRPTWLEISKALENKVEIRYLLGGLAPDSDVLMPEQMQKDIAGYWRKIQQHIPNTQFNFDFWENCQPRRSTYPACRAVIAARKQNKEVELAMIEGIQKAYYLNAQNPSDDDTLISLAKSLALDSQIFTNDLNNDETQKQLESEITFGREIGAQGFPSMILEKKGNFHVIPLDYNNASITIQYVSSL